MDFLTGIFSSIKFLFVQEKPRELWERLFRSSDTVYISPTEKLIIPSVQFTESPCLNKTCLNKTLPTCPGSLTLISFTGVYQEEEEIAIQWEHIRGVVTIDCPKCSWEEESVILELWNDNDIRIRREVLSEDGDIWNSVL
jgi:hypothetical protein